MSVIAKFTCNEVGILPSGSGQYHKVRLNPVTGNRSDPSGVINLAGVRQEVADQFELGEEYYCLITPASLGRPRAVFPGQR